MKKNKGRFHSANEMALKHGSWNDNAVSKAIGARLQEENEKGIEIGFGNLRQSYETLPERLPSHQGIEFDSPLEDFLSCIDAGYYPAPEIMVAISRCFNSYLAAKGDISLDEVFFGDRHSKRKSFAYKKHKTGWSSEYVLFEKWLKLAEGNSMEKAADEFLSKYFPHLDVDSFLRGYRRFKSGQ